MKESANKGRKLPDVNDKGQKRVEVEVKGSDGAIPKNPDVGRIKVTGFDTNLPCDVFESALRKHFASCGEITDVYIPLSADGTLFGFALIYFLGEASVDKALQLNGSDVGGWNVSAEAWPFQRNANCSASLRVTGYDPWLSEVAIKRALDKLFSSCGIISEVVVVKGGSSLVSIDGEDVALKAPLLSGSYIGGRKVVVERTSDLQKSTVHTRRGLLHGGSHCGFCLHARNKAKKAKMSAE